MGEGHGVVLVGDEESVAEESEAVIVGLPRERVGLRKIAEA